MRRMNRTMKIWRIGGLIAMFLAVVSACYSVKEELVTVVAGAVAGSDTGAGIPGIEVVCLQNITYTDDADGYYQVDVPDTEVPEDGAQVTCTFSDVDGAENGNYASKEGTFTCTAGKVAQMDVELDPIDQAQ